TAGRGCGAEWDADRQQVTHFCTADLQLIEVGPGDTHEYPVRVYPEVGPLQLTPGTYVVEQTVDWWRPSSQANRSQFTIRLTYEVSERNPADLDVSVQAQVVGSGTPITVAATGITRDSEGRPAHGVVVTWTGTGTVMLEDARFT